MSKYKVILFDADNTLFDTESTFRYALKDTMKQLGMEYTDEIGEWYSYNDKLIWEDFERGNTPAEVLIYARFIALARHLHEDFSPFEFHEIYNESIKTYCIPIKNSVEVCSEICKDYPLYIVTNGVSDFQLARLDLSEIKHCFKDVFTADIVGSNKPKPDFFDFVFEKTGITNKDEVLLVGDSLSADVLGAMNAGIDCCWFNFDNLIVNDTDFTPTYEISDLSQLIDILK